MHIFKIYNKLLWEESIDLIERFGNIIGKDFRYRSYNALEYNSDCDLGVIIGEPKNGSGFLNYTLGIFQLNNTDVDNRFGIYYNITLDLKQTGNKPNEIISSIINENGIWVLNSINQIYFYVEDFNKFL